MLCIFVRGPQPLDSCSPSSCQSKAKWLSRATTRRDGTQFRAFSRKQNVLHFPRALLCWPKLLWLINPRRRNAELLTETASGCDGEVLCIFARGSQPLDSCSPSSCQSKAKWLSRATTRRDGTQFRAFSRKQNALHFPRALLCWPKLLWLINPRRRNAELLTEIDVAHTPLIKPCHWCVRARL